MRRKASAPRRPRITPNPPSTEKPARSARPAGRPPAAVSVIGGVLRTMYIERERIQVRERKIVANLNGLLGPLGYEVVAKP